MISHTNKKEDNLKLLFAEFVTHCKYSIRLRSETIRGYENTFKLFIKIMPEILLTQDLTSRSLDEFFKRLDTRERKLNNGEIRVGVKDTTIKTYWAKLRTFFEWLKINKYIEENPFEGKKSPRVSYDDFKRLTDSEVNRLISCITESEAQSFVKNGVNSFTYCRDIFMLNLFLRTGVRRTEFLSFRLTDLDLYKRTITVRGETSKSKFSRTLKMTPVLFMLLSSYLVERKKLNYKTDSLIVSATKDNGLTIDGLNHWTKRLIKESGVKFHPHMFRHTFACKLVEENVNIYIIKELMGHKDIRMTVKYLRSLNTADMGEDLEKISFN